MFRTIVFGLIGGLILLSCRDEKVEPETDESLVFESCLVFVDGDFQDIPLDSDPHYIAGGSDSLYVELLEAIKYPVEARENGIQGLTFTSFEITEEGIVVNIQDENSESPVLAEATLEALAFLEGQAAFEPAVLNSAQVRVRKTIKVRYRLL